MSLTSDFDYVASVSHDLKSPLNAIIGFVELIKTGILAHDAEDGAPLEVLEDLKMVENLSKDMLALISNMLTAARIQAGKQPMMPTVITKQELLERASMLERTFQAEAKSRNIDFAVSVGALPRYVYWDIQQIRNFAVNNLISNALKFVGEDGIVRVYIDTNDKDIVSILVADNGPGVPEQERAAIFEKFAQSSGNAWSHTGSGYGLYNAVRVVHAHKGRLEILDGLENKGATFAMTLPAVPFEICGDLLRAAQAA
ncbi:sensor histidine kinase [Methylogaea oryzae]|uniref:histidine kinase n=1 Tax=Methylogaea oryzae TaxID=1295382 RepID=A0A8D4VNP1_9GAMM|nr:HAMP domain-containing sensor histidine kinase [Methylogaea oryzae]BBL70412.1 hypothetical protein MoryE10_10180 [Methylogaea oryzae]